VISSVGILAIMVEKGSVMDSKDKDLIALLRRNGRESIANLAAALGVSRATVRSRLDKLQTNGDVTGFTVKLREDSLAYPVRGMTMIKIDGHRTDRIIGRLNRIRAVQSVYKTNGRWDLIVDFATETLTDFDAALSEMRMIEGIAESETSILLAAQHPRPRR
jgi:DNA-binding Lrp family transcriptional regulator